MEKLEPILSDPDVVEIMVNSFDSVYVDRAGRIEAIPDLFESAEEVRVLIDSIIEPLGRRLDERSPIVDVRFADGSRMHAIIPPIAPNGPSFVIRKVMHERVYLGNLLAWGALDETAVTFLGACVEGALNIVVAGGAGSGKTTLLEALVNHIPQGERLIAAEHNRELDIDQPNLVQLEARPPNLEGTGAVTVTDLIVSALKMRPDRVIVSDVRGSEALHLLQVMNTGHDGSMFAMHAANPRDALTRFEMMALMANPAVPVRSLRQQIASAFDVVIYIERLHSGERRITRMAEVVDLQGDTIVLQDLFIYSRETGTQPTGILPSFLERLLERGIELPDELFGIS